MRIKYRLREMKLAPKPSDVFDAFDTKYGVFTDASARSLFVLDIISAKLSLAAHGHSGDYLSRAVAALNEYYHKAGYNLAGLPLIKEIYEPIWLPMKAAVMAAKQLKRE